MLVGDYCAIGAYPKLSPRNRNGNVFFSELEMENNEGLIRLFARVDKIVGVLESLGVYLPVEDVNLKIVEVLTTDYESE